VDCSRESGGRLPFRYVGGWFRNAGGREAACGMQDIGRRGGDVAEGVEDGGTWQKGTDGSRSGPVKLG
jgi:hypothetical protein